jgi:hypothetical protein
VLAAAALVVDRVEAVAGEGGAAGAVVLFDQHYFIFNVQPFCQLRDTHCLPAMQADQACAVIVKICKVAIK